MLKVQHLIRKGQKKRILNKENRLGYRANGLSIPAKRLQNRKWLSIKSQMADHKPARRGISERDRYFLTVAIPDIARVRYSRFQELSVSDIIIVDFENLEFQFSLGNGDLNFIANFFANQSLSNGAGQ